MWNTDIQARFRLDQPVKGGQVERLLTNVYTKAKSAGIDDSVYDDVFLNMPDSYKYEDEDGEEVKMNAAQYDEYTRDVGKFSWMTLTNMASTTNSKAWNDLTVDQQLYAVEKTYAYAKSKYKKDINPEYSNTGLGKKLWECYDENATPSQVASTIIEMAQGYDKQKKRSKKKG